MLAKYMIFGLLLVLMANVAEADSQKKDQQEQEKPSLELLEFLGEWETDSGKWIDPSTMDQIVLPEQGSKDSEK